jgi:hypothetical protein
MQILCSYIYIFLNNIVSERVGRLSRYSNGKDSFLLHSVQTGSGAHPVSYPMGTEGSFPGGGAAGV